jgi:hypothetical protein
MKRKQKEKPVALGDDLKTLSARKKPMSNSKQSNSLSTVVTELSWSNIQDQIAALLYATKKIPEKTEILSIILDYAGGAVANDKVIPVKIITRKGVQVTYF